MLSTSRQRVQENRDAQRKSHKRLREAHPQKKAQGKKFGEVHTGQKSTRKFLVDIKNAPTPTVKPEKVIKKVEQQVSPCEEDFPEIEYMPQCVDTDELTTTEWRRPRYLNTLVSSMFPSWGCAGSCCPGSAEQDEEDHFKAEDLKFVPERRPDSSDRVTEWSEAGTGLLDVDLGELPDLTVDLPDFDTAEPQDTT